MNIIETISYKIFYATWNEKFKKDNGLLKHFVKSQLKWMKKENKIDDNLKKWLKENIINES